MTILLPYTRLHPVTARLANQHAPGHQRERIDPADDGAYWRLLADAWPLPGDLTVIEQDVGLRRGVIEGFDTCRGPWCAHPYPIGRQLLTALGCTRFTGALRRAEPDLLEAVGRIGGDGIPAKHWRRLDARLTGELRRRGYSVHEHQPPVAHYHRYPA